MWMVDGSVICKSIFSERTYESRLCCGMAHNDVFWRNKMH